MSSQVNGRPTGPGGTVKDQEIAAEQRYVDIAYARLEEMRADAQAMIREGYRQSLAGTKGSLVDRDAMVHQAALRAQALDVADDGLVFGRLDLASREVRYIGRIGVRTSEHDSLVIDWRAPAAEDFYRATPEDPRGVVRRRVLHSRGHTVVDLEDDLLDPDASDGMTIVGDGAFLASLARTREGAMRDIVATIQREQDEVIRAPADGTVLVRGAPGTGKTAVALHRVAYLLFRHRRRFGSRGVLVIGPNRRFTAYIERVLPSLGEGSATLRSLGDLVEGVTATVHDPPETARVKGAGAMAAVLRRAVADHPPGAPDELRVVHKGVVVTLDRARLDRIRTELHRRGRGSVNAARGRAAEMLLDALWERFTDIGGPEAAEAEEGAEAGLWNAILAADGLASLDDERRAAGGRGTATPSAASSTRGSASSAPSPTSSSPGGRSAGRWTCSARWATPPGCAAPPAATSTAPPSSRSPRPGPATTLRSATRTSRCSTSWTRCSARRPARPAAGPPRPRTTRSSSTASTSSPARRSWTTRGSRRCRS
ncbi:HelD family protein [Actinomadura madurae]|uniref:HelD family protein n=1 Tax=Actinomadura madurae TaxID=1993 RepID=UPI0020D2570D|nr:AAA family ATPase [Actinomadura madurae]MCP9950586.1 AAA family ATPase [Actinomadura madurae]MCP9979826.1 AAA family ATPase [Actinomadura madurae]MCQ0008645.1 AAA family ATPase [Actinomadura madurae]